MSDAHHAHFTLVRDIPQPPARVWGAFADHELKKRWFGARSDLYDITEHTFDFRPGGEERQVGRWHSGMTSDFRGRRITYVYEMVVNDWKMSVSLATIEIEPHGDGTRLTVTEQGVFFGEDGAKNAAGRKKGTEGILDGIATSLEG